MAPPEVKAVTRKLFYRVLSVDFQKPKVIHMIYTI